jgi:Uma2 family endonuclease
MSTVTELRLESDVSLQIPATWGAYLRLLRARGDAFWPKYVFCDGRLTIVSPGFSHELLRTRLSWIVGEMLFELGINFVSAGSVTLKQGKPGKKGVEGDASFYVTNLEGLKGKRNLSMGSDPPPDLAIEVVISHPADDSLKVYASFGVKEVWVLREDALTFMIIQPDGSCYEPSPVSACIPVLVPEELAHWVLRDDFADDLVRRRAAREWIQNVLRPRYERRRVEP